MATVHMMLQKKGGVGKSTICSFWMQFLKEQGYSVDGMDTDPANKTFSAFTELKVSKLELLDANDDIDPRKFDLLVDMICKLPKSRHLVIDTGSSCFTSLFAYLKHNNAFGVISGAGHPIYIHTPVAGGADVLESTESLVKLVQTFPSLSFVIWKNRYHGDLVVDTVDGQVPFEQFKDYPIIDQCRVATIEIPFKNPATFGKDIELLMAKKWTFQAGKTAPSLPVMVRERLTLFWRDACEAMTKGLVFDPPEKETKNVIPFDPAEKKNNAG
jgi:hypothetical protein